METKFEKEIKQIITFYFACRSQFKHDSFSSGHIDYTNPFYLYYRDVEIALSLLDFEQRALIETIFFYPNSNPNWWQEKYSKRAFFSLKQRAIKNFVRRFYEIH